MAPDGKRFVTLAGGSVIPTRRSPWWRTGQRSWAVGPEPFFGTRVVPTSDSRGERRPAPLRVCGFKAGLTQNPRFKAADLESKVCATDGVSVIDFQPKLNFARVIRLAINQSGGVRKIVKGRTVLVPARPQAENRAVKNIQEVHSELDTHPFVHIRAFDDGEYLR